MGMKYERDSKEHKDNLARRIGSRLKELRKSIGLSLKQLTEETKLSTPLFSRIENGLVMPSIPTLQKISDILKVDIGYFFKEEEERGYVVSYQGARKVVYSERASKGKISYEIELLADGFDNPFMEPVIVTLVGAEDEVDIITHGGQEFLYVLQGKMELTLGMNKFRLKKGDSVYFNGSIPHKGISLSKKLARTLNIHVIPGRRIGTFQTNN